MKQPFPEILGDANFRGFSSCFCSQSLLSSRFFQKCFFSPDGFSCKQPIEIAFLDFGFAFSFLVCLPCQKALLKREHFYRFETCWFYKWFLVPLTILIKFSDSFLLDSQKFLFTSSSSYAEAVGTFLKLLFFCLALLYTMNSIMSIAFFKKLENIYG